MPLVMYAAMLKNARNKKCKMIIQRCRQFHQISLLQFVAFFPTAALSHKNVIKAENGRCATNHL